MKDSNDWQKKYKDSIRELDDQIRQWESVEELLRRVIGRLCIAGRGINGNLDQSLKGIQQLSRKKDNTGLEKQLKQLNDLIVKLDSPQSENTPDHKTPDPILLLLELLGHINFDTDQRAELKEISSQLLKSIAAGISQERLKPHITLLAKLINENFYDSSEASENHLDKDAIISHLERFEFEDEGLFQIRQDLQSASDTETLTDSINRVFIRIGEILGELKNKKGELETFIVQVKSQLTEITGVITDQQKDSKTESTQTQILQNTLDEGVNRITEELKTSDDIETLKNVIGNNISVLKAGMTTFVAQAAQRRETTEARNRLLQSKISEMENQTRILQTQIAENREKMLTDALTGALNRLAYDEELSRSLLYWNEHNKSFIYAIFDIDFFKRINDQYGHVAGDKALRVIAQIIQKQTRASDFLFRVGGEEFVMFFNGITLPDAAKLVKKIRSSIENAEVHFKQKRVVLTLSAGITEVAANDTAEILYDRADKALYAAKEAGRNCQIEA